MEKESEKKAALILAVMFFTITFTAVTIHLAIQYTFRTVVTYTFRISIATMIISILTLAAAGIYIPEKVNPYAFWTLLTSFAIATITGITLLIR